MRHSCMVIINQLIQSNMESTNMRNRNKLDVLCLLFVGLITRSNAEWTTWAPWSPCSITCGDGIQTRDRACMGPNENDCAGPSIMYNACNIGDCGQPNEVWSVWGEWSDCSKTCGGGIHVRTRSCLLGDVTECCAHLDSEGCEYEHYQTRECINTDCQGDWSAWRPWGKCSVPCGEGNQTRERDCVPDDTVCSGPEKQTRSCYAQCAPSSSGLGRIPSCSYGNPCKNNGVCARSSEHVTCFCAGDWRGPDCNSMCLRPNQGDVCTNKEGIFHMCSDCTKFIICSRGHAISMTCVDGRLWTGDGCKLPSETTAVCIEW